MVASTGMSMVYWTYLNYVPFGASLQPLVSQAPQASAVPSAPARKPVTRLFSGTCFTLWAARLLLHFTHEAQKVYMFFPRGY